MPFKSEAQKRYLWANEPEIARDWTDTYGSRIKKDSGGIMELNEAVIVDDDGNTYEESPLSNFRTEEEFNEQFKDNIQDPDDMEGYALGDPDTYKQGILTQLKNYAINPLKQYGINPLKQGLSMGLGALTGIPFLGNIMAGLTTPNPSDPMSRSFAVGNPNATFGQQYAGGRLPGQDAFGINTVSMFGNYPAYYDQYARDYRAGKYSPTSKFAANKYAHAQAVNKANQERIARDFANTDAEDDYGAGNYVETVGPVVVANSSNNVVSQRPDRPDRPDKSGATGQNTGGFTNPGKGSYGPHKADGGRIGFFDSISGMRDALKAMGYDWIDAADDLTVRQIFNSEKGTWTDSSVWRPGSAKGGRVRYSRGGLTSL